MALRKIYLMILIGGLLSLGVQDRAQAQDLSRYEALFIDKFLDYVKWPSVTSNHVIGVMGNKELYKALEQVASKKGGKFSVIELTSADQVTNCHLVYLAKSKDKLFSAISGTCRDNSILLVTQNGNLAEKGASIGFFTTQNKLNFKVNKSAIESANMKISKSLLSLGKVVG